MSHPCAIPHCGTMIRDGLLMCPSDWRKVPAAIQAEVNRTWAVYRDIDVRGSMENFRAARTAYYAAKDAAVAAVVGPQTDLPLTT